MTIFLHIGLSKTGTTFVQHCFNQPQIDTQLREGFQLKQSINASTIIWALVKKDIISVGSKNGDPIERFLNYENVSNATRVEVRKLIRGEIQDSVRHLFFSAEGISDLAVFNKKFVNSKSFVQIIKDFVLQSNLTQKLKIILTIRRQDQFLESSYMQNIRTGSTLSFDDYVKLIPMKNLSWLTLIEHLTDVVGNKNLIVLPYESELHRLNGNAHFLQPLLKSIDQRITMDALEINGLTPIQQMPIGNPTLLPEKLSAAIEANKTLPSSEAFTAYKELAKKFPKLPGQPFNLLSNKKRAELISHFSNENSMMFTKFLPEYNGSFYIQELKA